jgi:8-oxo-dGTP pyrophosphatase MutT (NUDIX family)
MAIGRFYGMVGALLRRPEDGKYLLLRRSGDKDFASGAWECVTGRVDQGEGFTQAVRREVREELGVEIQIDFIVGTAHFFRGEARPENEIIGVQYCCTLEEPHNIQVSAEHSEHRWLTATEAEEMLPYGHWLREVIRRAEELRTLMPDALLAHHRLQGFEL